MPSEMSLNCFITTVMLIQIQSIILHYHDFCIVIKGYHKNFDDTPGSALSAKVQKPQGFGIDF